MLRYVCFYLSRCHIKYSILLLQIEQSLDKMGYPDFMMNDQQLASIYQTVSSCRNHIWIEI
jgi:hypothetical protein